MYTYRSDRLDLGGSIGQVFRPENSGVLDQITAKKKTSGNGCVDHKIKIYEWLGNRNSNPTDAKGVLLAESAVRSICSYTGYPNPVDFTWDFVGDNETVLLNSKYYFLEIPAWGNIWWLPTATLFHSSNDALIDGDAWFYDGIWQSTNRDSYLIIEGEIMELLLVSNQIL